MAFRTLFFCLISGLATVQAVTVYGQTPLGATTTPTSAAPGATYTGLKAYDTTTLTPPALPNPLPATQFAIQLEQAAANVPGLSIQVSGSMFGFSIETSVITQVCE